MGSPSFLTHPMFNMGFLLASMQISKKIDWADPTVLTCARIGFYATQLLTIILSYYLIHLIKKKNDLTILSYPTSTGENKTRTIQDYDIEQVQAFIKSTLSSVLITSVMHFQFNFTQPLLMQSVLPLKNFLTHKESLIYIWGDPVQGQLVRPFETENPLSSITGLFQASTDHVHQE